MQSVARASQSDEDSAAAREYAQSRADLVRFLVRLCGDAAVAEELAQEAGIRLLAEARAGTVREPRAFLFHVAANLARDQLRRNVVAQHYADEYDTSESAPATDHVTSVRQEIATVARAMEALPKRPREVLMLARVEGYSQKEIADRLGLSPKTVENHLTRALAQLAQRLQRSRQQ